MLRVLATEGMLIADHLGVESGMRHNAIILNCQHGTRPVRVNEPREKLRIPVKLFL
jgi:hypothetical protein